MRHLARQHAHCPGTFSASTPGVAVWDCADGSTMPTIAEEMPTIAEEMPTMAERMLAGIAAGDEDMIAGIEAMIAAVEGVAAMDADPPGDVLPAAAAGDQ